MNPLTVIRTTLRRSTSLRQLVQRVRGRRLHSPDIVIPYTVLGSEYGGWAVPSGVIMPSSVVYSVGVGEDATFDLALLDATGCTVHAFDPTPIAVDWVGKQVLPANFRFHPIGLAASDGEHDFHLPPVEGWHSFSATPEPGSAISGTVRCAVRRLSSLSAMLGHPHIDLLKMDIEGFEYDVIDDMLASGPLPDVLLVEFHHLVYGIEKKKTVDAVSALRARGYRIFWIGDSGREYGFVNRAPRLKDR